MVSTTRGTLSRAAAEKAEGKKPVTEEGSGSRKSGSEVMKSKDYAEIFDQMSFVFWSIMEHMGHKEHGGTWRMEAAQLDTQRKKGEVILKTSSTVHSTGQASTRSSWEVKVKPEKCCFPLDFPLTLNLILFVFKGS
ncbi:unnamed protein product [Microthlaspi erraticum]|uniref:Uncharacterized protein n=1 Tax=Microthlaspi erraticum TaxID=1685480 RepID=A0A6D2JKU7_9BRAS|nr:unnamed protein product [Microthlaspi erraticum]